MRCECRTSRSGRLGRLPGLQACLTGGHRCQQGGTGCNWAAPRPVRACWFQRNGPTARISNRPSRPSRMRASRIPQDDRMILLWSMHLVVVTDGLREEGFCGSSQWNRRSRNPEQRRSSIALAQVPVSAFDTVKSVPVSSSYAGSRLCFSAMLCQ